MRGAPEKFMAWPCYQLAAYDNDFAKKYTSDNIIHNLNELSLFHRKQ